MAIRDRRCNVIIDSCCDLPSELVDSFEIEVMQFAYFMDDGEHLDDLGVSIPPREFYERMRKGEEPKTAQVPYARIVDTFERAAQSGVPTVFLMFSSGLSGTYETAIQVMGETHKKYPDAELYVVDTLLASAAEGLFVIEAIRQLDRGLSARELVAWAEEARYYVHGYFTLANLETLRRGGRIPNMAAIAGAKLDIKPILTIDLTGRLSFHSVTRGRKKAIKQLLQIYNDHASKAGGETVLVASADAEKEQLHLREQVLRMAKAKVVWSSNIGPVIGSHVGPDMLAIVFWGPDRRQEISITDRIANAVSERSEAFRSHFSGVSTADAIDSAHTTDITDVEHTDGASGTINTNNIPVTADALKSTDVAESRI